MDERLRTILLVASAIVAAGCGESFTVTGTTSGDTTTSSTISAGGGDPGSGGADSGGASTGGVTSSGSGGATCDSVDHDDDGYSECDGDCDDTLPFVHPGALEICGDGVDQDCDGAADAGLPCDGFGTFVSELHGANGAPGTLENPVATIAEGVQHAAQIGIPTAILVAAGQYSEDVTLTGSMSLIGGYDPEDWSVRDPAVHVTTLMSTTVEGLKIAAAAEPPLYVDGFVLRGLNVASPNQPSIAVSVQGGNVLLAHDVIEAGQVSAGSGASVGVRISSAAGASGTVGIFETAVKAGIAFAGPSYGVQINAASTTLALVSSRVTAAKGADSVALYIASSAGVTALANTLQSDTATGTNNVPSASFGVWARSGGPLLLDTNNINPDQVASSPKCFTPAAWCGGVRVSTANSALTNNVIFGGASDWSTAVQLVEELASLDAVVVNANLLLAVGQSGLETNSAAVVIGSPRIDAQPTKVGVFRNNIFYGGAASNNYGVFEQRLPGEACGPAALDHDLFFLPGGGALYSAWSGALATNLGTLAELPGAGDNLSGDPKLSGAHLKATSPCRNAGTNLGAPTFDLDGDERPQESTFDIGPDEFLP